MRADLPHWQLTPMPRFASFKLSMQLIALSLVGESVEEEVMPQRGVFIRVGPRMRRLAVGSDPAFRVKCPAEPDADEPNRELGSRLAIFFTQPSHGVDGDNRGSL